jgi:hypothetical protein
MKSLRILLTAICVTAGLSLFAQNTITQELVNISISGETTREELMYLRNDLQQVGVNFEYSPRFDGNRHLVGIEFTVKGTGFESSYNLEQFAPNQAVQVNITRTPGSNPVVNIQPVSKK